MEAQFEQIKITWLIIEALCVLGFKLPIMFLMRARLKVCAFLKEDVLLNTYILILDVSEIPTQEGTSSEDTHARADELDEFEALQPERRVSVLFILFIMLGYTAGGACLMQLWEKWSFVDAFYFCAVTVTTIGVSSFFLICLQ